MRQTGRERIVWLVVDDGSTDNTKAVVESLRAGSDFPVVYIRGQGAGKHDAFNLAIAAASTELLLDVDSDDLLADGALGAIAELYEKIKNDEGIGGFAGTTSLLDGKPLNKPYAEEGFICDTMRIKDLHHIHDVPEVYRTDILKKYRFPIFAGERFVTEAYLFDELTAAYPLRYYNRTLKVVEYLADGLSSKSAEIRRKSPRGAVNYYFRRFRLTKSPVFKLKAALNFARFAIWAPREAARLGLRSPLLGLCALVYSPFGLVHRAMAQRRAAAPRKRRIIVVDPVCDARQHEIINATIVLAARQACPADAEFRLVCDPGHEAALRRVWSRFGLEAPSYLYKPFLVSGRFPTLRKFFLSLGLGLRPGDVCISTFQEPFFVAGTLLAHGCRFYVAEHGFLGSFDMGWTPKNFAKSFVYFTLGRHCRYLLFGESIWRRAGKLLPGRSSRFVSFPLPYLYHDVDLKEQNAQKPVRIAQMIGAHVLPVHSPLFAAERILAERGLEERAELHLHGVFKRLGFIPPQGSRVCVSYKEGLDDSTSRDEVMASADYLVLCPPPENYRLMASGAIFDALSFCVPVIALRNDYFSWLEEEVGPIGIFVDHEEDLPAAIADAAAQFDPAAALAFRRGMRERRDRLGVDAVAGRIREFL
jgi:hypothetical protein